MENTISSRDEDQDRSPQSVIIYLTGKPGVGKYTIAKAIAQNYGYIVCDNQLINNPIFELIQADGITPIPNIAWKAIAKLRTIIFDFISQSPQKSYVLTNNLYEDKDDRTLYEDVKSMAERRESLFVPVNVQINTKEHLKRVVDPKRTERWKSINPKDVHDKTPLLSIDHPHLLNIDVSSLSPDEAAKTIEDYISNLKNRFINKHEKSKIRGTNEK